MPKKRVQDALPDAPSVAEVLLVADPDSIYYVNERCPEALAFNQSMRNALAKTGAPYRTPGVSVTMMGGWQAVYAHDYRLYTPEKLAQVERFAGVHRYVDACTPVFAKENFLAVHTVRGGQMAVKLLKRAGRVVDLLTGETVARDADSFEADFATPDTRLFGVCGASPR